MPPVCTCLRDGLEEEFEAKYLVPGDLVLLVTGDRVPADIRLVQVLLVTGDRVPAGADIRLVQVLLVTGDRVPSDITVG